MSQKQIYFALAFVAAIGIAIVLYTNRTFVDDNPANETQLQTNTSFESLSQKIHAADSLYKAGNTLLMENQFRQILNTEDTWCKTLSNHQYAWTYDWLAEFYLRLSDLEKAQQYNEYAIKRLDSIDDLDFKTNVLNNRAIIESDMGNYEKGIEFLFECMQLYKSDTINANFIDFYNNIGSFYTLSKNYDLAITYFGKLRRLAEQLDKEDEYGYYHANMGYTYSLMGDYEKSLVQYETAQHYFEKHNLKDDLAMVNSLIAAEYVTHNRIEEAEAILLKNLKEAEQRKLWELYVETAISLFDVYVAKGETNKAHNILNTGMAHAHYTNSNRLHSKIYEKLIEYYAEQRDYENAFAYQQKFKAIQDSLFDQSKSDFMQELTVKYETDRKNDHITQLEILNEKERRINTFYLVGLVLTIAVLLLIFVLLRRISTQKKALEEANQTKDKLFSIIAHDLRSPMIALQGMGDLIAYYIKKEDHKKLSELGTKTNDTLSRIHHLLDNLLNWAVTNSNQITFRPETKQIKDIIDETIILHQAGIASKCITVNTTTEDTAIEVDWNMMSTVFRNLLSNAIKNTPQEGAIIIKGILSHNQYNISIQDSGDGFPKEVLEKLSKAENTLVAGGGKESFGLGLQLVIHFIAQHKGTINFRNNDIGAFIEISLPLKQKQ